MCSRTILVICIGLFCNLGYEISPNYSSVKPAILTRFGQYLSSTPGHSSKIQEMEYSSYAQVNCHSIYLFVLLEADLSFQLILNFLPIVANSLNFISMAKCLPFFFHLLPFSLT